MTFESGAASGGSCHVEKSGRKGGIGKLATRHANCWFWIGARFFDVTVMLCR